jgi:hypothetical protein
MVEAAGIGELKATKQGWSIQADLANVALQMPNLPDVSAPRQGRNAEQG